MKLLVLTILLLHVAMVVRPGHGQSRQPEPGQQVEMTYKTSDDTEVGYLLYLPDGFKADSATRYPLMLFLHGRGESNGPLSLVAKWGPPMMAARGDKLPYIIVSPQCPRKDNWTSDTQQTRLIELLDAIEDKYPIDKQRVFLTGLSMGGYGTWELAANHADRFTAAVPVCGGGNPEDAGKLKELPIWVFHGELDRAVAFKKSVEMVDAIRKAGGTKIRFTTLEHIGHNCWSATYATPELYQWMEKQAKR